jgi:glycosyltransferase involved in cell wall biosynthesis
MRAALPTEATGSSDQVLILHDGGSLAAFKNKGNLTHYVDTLYNPGNYFARAHIVVFDKADLSVDLKNPTLRVHYLRHLSLGGPRPGRLARYIGRGLSLPYMLYQTVQVVRREGITVIRARNAYLAGLLAVLTGKICGVPVVVSLGGDNRIAQELLGRYYTYSRFLSFRIEEFSLRRADRVFCTNEFTRRYAIRLGVPPEKTRVVPHRIDLHLLGMADEDSARHEFGLGQRPMVLFIGRFERDKQVDVVIEAIPAILKRHPETAFVFIGDGSMRAELQARCAELQIGSAAMFVGYQTREQIAKYLAAASVVWIPMSGFVIYEAAAARRPIVAFDVEWHSEFVEHNVTGLLVRDRDVQHVAEAVIAILDDPGRARTLAANAERKLREGSDQGVLVKEEIREYAELISSASARHD